MVSFCTGDVIVFLKSAPHHSIHMLCYVNMSKYYSHVLTVNHSDREHVREEKALWIFFFLFDG